MATIGAPINQADLQNALGVSSSVNKWSLLIAHGNTNKWSAYKSIYATKVTKLTDAERAAGTHVVSGYSMSYGIQKRVSAVWSDFYNAQTLAIVSAPWYYDKPVWDGSCKFRITDFIGYRTDAPRLINITYNGGEDMWIPSASGDRGSSFWMQLTGMSTVSAQNTGAMRWQELFGDCLDYYPTIIMVAGASWIYAKSHDLTIRGLIAAGNTGASIYIDTKDLADAMIVDGASYNYFPLNNNASWNVCMVLCSIKIAGGSGSLQHNIPSGANILRCEYEANVDRTVKKAKLLKYKAFASMKMQATLIKESGSSYKYRLDELTLIAEKMTTDAVSFTCNFTLTARVGTVNVQGKGRATGGQSLTVNDYLGTISFAASDLGTITKTWKYNATSGNSLPYTTYDVTEAEPSSGERNVYGNFTFVNNSIGSFSGGWQAINVNGQNYRYYQEFTLF